MFFWVSCHVYWLLEANILEKHAVFNFRAEVMSLAKPTNQPAKKLRAESGAGARRCPLQGLTIPAYEMYCWKW
jgi:hypothetical protein